jgi:hypothetical protein
MLIQSVGNQTNFNGKLVLTKGTFPVNETAELYSMSTKFKEIASLVANKPYDVFISRNKDNPEFFDVAANKTLQEAQKIKEYSVKVRSNTMLASVVDATKDAMDMYEKFIAKNFKG